VNAGIWRLLFGQIQFTPWKVRVLTRDKLKKLFANMFLNFISKIKQKVVFDFIVGVPCIFVGQEWLKEIIKRSESDLFFIC
jgi:hypothetical protein